MTTTPPATDLNESLAKLDLTSDNAAIIGLQYGDEGKGQIVDIFGSRYDVVARYNGGANAGHTVIVGDQKIALHLIPSGIMCLNAVNVIGNGVVIDPAQILKEIDGLNEKGMTTDHLVISDRAHVVMPWHKVQDGLYDQAMAAAKAKQLLNRSLPTSPPASSTLTVLRTVKQGGHTIARRLSGWWCNECRVMAADWNKLAPQKCGGSAIRTWTNKATEAARATNSNGNHGHQIMSSFPLFWCSVCGAFG